MLMLETEDLSIGHAGNAIVCDVNLAVPAGRIVGLLGGNGSGKSTFFKTILNLLPPLAGCIRLNGLDSSSLTPAQRVALVGYVPQMQGTSLPFQVEEFVLMGRASQIGLFQQPAHADREICHFYLDLLHIMHLRKCLLSELSGGEQQLVLIARTLVQESRLLLMDEPTSSLDFKNQIQVLDNIEQLRQHGYTIIFSSHQPNQIAQSADTLLLLNQHSMMQIEQPRQFFNAENLARLYQLDIKQVCKYMGI